MKRIWKSFGDEGKVAFSSGSILSRQKVILTENEIGTWNGKNHQLNEQVNTNKIATPGFQADYLFQTSLYQKY